MEIAPSAIARDPTTIGISELGGFLNYTIHIGPLMNNREYRLGDGRRVVISGEGNIAPHQCTTHVASRRHTGRKFLKGTARILS